MTAKPKTAAGYSREQSELVRSTCLYVATKLGDLIDSMVVVGGLVPSLLIDQDHRPPGVEQHTGTLDLDLGLHAKVLDKKLYAKIADRLRGAGFVRDHNDKSNVTNQTWCIQGPRKQTVTVDFLIQPTRRTDEGGKLRNLESDFAAIISPGLHLAFKDRQTVVVTGMTIFGENATREIHVAGAGAFVVLKCLAFKIRGANKDAYDLFYVVRNFGNGVEDIVTALMPLIGDKSLQAAVEVLRMDFLSPNAIGPRRVAEFLYSRPDDETQADVVGVIDELLRRLPIKR